MRKMFLTALTMLAVFSTTALAQITINNNFQPVPGTVLQSRGDAQADSALFYFASNGNGGPMTWDFSNRVYGGNFAVTVIELSTSPSLDSFPNANLVFKAILGTDTSWIFYQSNSNVFTGEGNVSRAPNGGSIIVYRNNAPDWTFPIAYGNSWTGYHHWTLHSGLFHTNILDTTYYSANAWGTARYNANSVSCLRVMSHERMTFNTYDSLNNLLFSSASDNYTANFIGAGFNTLVGVSKEVSSNTVNYSSDASAEFLGQQTPVAENGALPNDFSIAQNYPNPFNPTTAIQYNLPINSDVNLTVYDIQGRRIETLVDDNQSAGSHIVIWNAADKPSGVYFYNIRAGDFTETKRMTLVK